MWIYCWNISDMHRSVCRIGTCIQQFYVLVSSSEQHSHQQLSSDHLGSYLHTSQMPSYHFTNMTQEKTGQVQIQRLTDLQSACSNSSSTYVYIYTACQKWGAKFIHCFQCFIQVTNAWLLHISPYTWLLHDAELQNKKLGCLIQLQVSLIITHLFCLIKSITLCNNMNTAT